MLFNSLEFAIFLPLVFTIYWILQPFNVRWQNSWVVVISYFFYGWWDARFLLLIAFSTLTDFSIGLWINRTTGTRNRKLLLWLSIVVNLGVLGFFKYFDFFLSNFTAAFTFLGMPVDGGLLHIVLPVGISFYTFQTLSYTIDVYRNKLKPVTDVIAFSAFVSFFPQLVAGPIERATNLLPQFTVKRQFSYDRAADGMRQLLWGFFKKLVVADSCAVIVNQVFETHEYQSGIVLIVGAVAFAFQIYGDFSGYSDIAIGTARLFGIDLMQNFRLPYFARDVADFWRRWHISLTSWFRDYVYIPLGGSRNGKWLSVRNTLVVFLVSGFWHGANWTFVSWGLYHAVLFLPLLVLNRNRLNINNYETDKRRLPDLRQLSQLLLTFFLVTIGWVFFRAESLADAFTYLGGIFNVQQGYFDVTTLFIANGNLSNFTLFFAVISILTLLITEWIQRSKTHALEISTFPYRGIVYIAIGLFIYLAKGGDAAFIYFQF